MRLITSITDFEPLFPPDTIDKSNVTRWTSPSPIKLAGDTTPDYTQNGHPFWGVDRLGWSLHENKFFLHDKYSGSWRAFSLKDIGELLGSEVSDDIEIVESEITEKPLSMQWDKLQVIAAHAIVDRAYWKSKAGWDDEVIDRFNVGKGTLYFNIETPLIPMQIESVDGEFPPGYYMAARMPDGFTSSKWMHSRGSDRRYLWKIQDEDNGVFALAEGAKDGISAWALGFKNFIVTFGVTKWSYEKTEYIKSRGCTKLVILSDRDIAGQGLATKAAAWATKAGLKVEILKWPEYLPASIKDISDISYMYGRKEGEKIIRDNLISPDIDVTAGVTRGVFIKKYSDLDKEYVPEVPTPISLDMLRGNDEGSLYTVLDQYITSFEDLPEPYLQLLEAGPGAGKTYAAIRAAEKVAREYKEVKLLELAKLHACEEELKKSIEEETDKEILEELHSEYRILTDNLERFTLTNVAWFAAYKDGWYDLINTGADDELWYNFEGRNPENCHNFSMAEELGRKMHDVTRFCQTVCPFKTQCFKSGYMRQIEERKKYPITFYRHQHLNGSDLIQNYAGMVVVDENSVSVVDGEAVLITPIDLSSSREGWDMNVDDRETVLLIGFLIDAVRDVLNLSHLESPKYYSDGEPNPRVFFSGNKVLYEIDARIRSTSRDTYNLKSILDGIDEVVILNEYQPNYNYSEMENIPLRCVPTLLTVLKRELDEYPIDVEKDYPTTIHISDGVLKLYAADLPTIPRSVPLVILDATAFDTLYSTMFRRRVMKYSPTILNPNAKTIIVTGSDWTKSSINSNIGEAIVARENEIRLQGRVAAAESRDFARSGVPMDERLSKNNLVQRATEVMLRLCDIHESLLVVTHKDLRFVLEDIADGAASGIIVPKRFRDRLMFGHFGALRGTNQFKDCEAALLIGAYRIPYNALLEKAQVWLALAKIKDELPKDTVIRPAPYYGTDYGHGYRTFDNDFLDQYVNMVEAGELIQDAARIRPHAGLENKTVYVLANRPALPYTTEIMHIKTFINSLRDDGKTQSLREYITEMLTGGNTITYSELAKKFSVSKSTISRVIKEIKNAG